MIPLPKRALLAFLEKQRAEGFADLDGAFLTASVPVPEALINELIAQTAPGSIEQLRLTFKDDDRVDLDLSASVPMLGTLRLQRELTVEKQIKRGDSLKLRIRISEGSFFDRMKNGAIAALASGRLPPFVLMQGSRIEIDLEEILRRQTIGREILPFIHSAEIEGRRGTLIVRFRLEAA